jgi:L-lysine exporter family protein LysE/ArgO
VRWFGVAFLTWYGLSSAWRARHPSALSGSADGNDAAAGTRAVAGAATAARVPGAGLAPTIRRTFALTWLNPHVYLDTVVLLGSIANTHGQSGRWWFAVGAAVGSILWFTGLGFGARFAAPLLTTPRAWQVLDLLIAATMLGIAAKLAI